MSAQLTRGCPAWCTDCTGPDLASGDDDWFHTREFPIANTCVVVFSVERLDGTIHEQGAQLPDLNFMSGADLRVYAALLVEVADFMDEHGIEVVWEDRRRIARPEGER